MDINPFRLAFAGKKHVFLPVIHGVSVDQVIRNILTAEQGGAHGVWLIDHDSYAPNRLRDWHTQVMERFPHLWVGVNYLCLEPKSALPYTLSATSGLWTDDGGIRLYDANPTEQAAEFKPIRQTLERPAIHFGGVAFKGQARVETQDLARVAELAVPFMDVITTSGVATGSEPDVEKIRMIREAIGDHPLAIASGMTPDNVRAFMPYANCFMVASGIGASFTELDPDKVRAFAKALQE